MSALVEGFSGGSGRFKVINGVKATFLAESGEIGEGNFVQMNHDSVSLGFSVHYQDKIGSLKEYWWANKPFDAILLSSNPDRFIFFYANASGVFYSIVTVIDEEIVKTTTPILIVSNSNDKNIFAYRLRNDAIILSVSDTTEYTGTYLFRISGDILERIEFVDTDVIPNNTNLWRNYTTGYTLNTRNIIVLDDHHFVRFIINHYGSGSNGYCTTKGVLMKVNDDFSIQKLETWGIDTSQDTDGMSWNMDMLMGYKLTDNLLMITNGNGLTNLTYYNLSTSANRMKNVDGVLDTKSGGKFTAYSKCFGNFEVIPISDGYFIGINVYNSSTTAFVAKAEKANNKTTAGTIVAGTAVAISTATDSSIIPMTIFDSFVDEKNKQVVIYYRTISSREIRKMILSYNLSEKTVTRISDSKIEGYASGAFSASMVMGSNGNPLEFIAANNDVKILNKHPVYRCSLSTTSIFGLVTKTATETVEGELYCLK